MRLKLFLIAAIVGNALDPAQRLDRRTTAPAAAAGLGALDGVSGPHNPFTVLALDATSGPSAENPAGQVDFIPDLDGGGAI
jgi:hypothetical protein